MSGTGWHRSVRVALAVLVGGCGARSGLRTDPTQGDIYALDAGDGTGDPGADLADRGCADVDVEAVRKAFVRCTFRLGGWVGQTRSVEGVSCEQVCCVFGFEECLSRNTQRNYDVCEPADPPPSGSCSDVFQPSWSSQCTCATQFR